MVYPTGLEKKGLSVIIASPEAADPQCSAQHTVRLVQCLDLYDRKYKCDILK